MLVQGSRPNSHLLAQHRELVGAGQASILFGLQSFGEGLDLPGELCEQLYICKLPFQPPSDPVGQARADFVQASGGDAFFDLVVPAAGVRMLQWTGRGLRTETDRVTITCYDARLVDTDFGKRILSGLPPYPLRVLAASAPSLI